MLSDPVCEFLRHTVATLAYRGHKVLRGAPEGFAVFRAGDQTRTPVEILAHIGDLLDWAVTLARGEERWHVSTPLEWQREIERFSAGLRALEEQLASGQAKCPAGKLFQGPIADALTHVGQLALLRGLTGSSIRGEDFSNARITGGQVGPDQPHPILEF